MSATLGERLYINEPNNYSFITKEMINWKELSFMVKKKVNPIQKPESIRFGYNN